MIIVSTTTTTHFINEGEFLEVRYCKDESRVQLFPKGSGTADVRSIDDVTSVSIPGIYEDAEPPVHHQTPACLYVRKEEADGFHQMYRTCAEALFRLERLLTGRDKKSFGSEKTRQELIGIIGSCFEEIQRQQLVMVKDT